MATKKRQTLIDNLDKVARKTIDDAGTADAAKKKADKLLKDFKKSIEAQALANRSGFDTLVLDGYKYQATIPLTVTLGDDQIAALHKTLGDDFVQKVETVHVSDPAKLWQSLTPRQRMKFMTRRTVFELKEDVDLRTLKTALGKDAEKLFEETEYFEANMDNLAELYQADGNTYSKAILDQAEYKAKSISFKKKD